MRQAIELIEIAAKVLREDTRTRARNKGRMATLLAHRLRARATKKQ